MTARLLTLFPADETWRERARRNRAELRESAGAAHRKLAAHMEKQAARHYRRWPVQLDKISFGLSMAPTDRILATCGHIDERGDPRGVRPRPTNLAGACIYARWLQRFGERADFLDAAE